MKTNLPIYLLFTGLVNLMLVKKAEGQNLVQNGTFSNYSTSWSSNCTIEINPESVYGGSSATNLVTEIDVERCINQPICIFPGMSYTLTFKGARRTNSSGTGPGSMSAPANAGITIKVTGDVSGTQYVNTTKYYSNTTYTYTSQSFSFSIPANATDKKVNLSFTSYNNNSTYGVLIDDIDLSPSTTLSITGTGSPTLNVNTTYSVANVPSAGVSYAWNFVDHATPLTSTAASPSVKWTTNGNRTITVALSNGTCTVATLSKDVVVSALLPVTLTGFRGRVSNEKVYLTWTTQQEENNRHFIVERSQDGNRYDSIGVVAGTNTSVEHSYAFTDAHPLNGTSYYRLKQVDYDNNYSYSSIVNVITGSGSQVLQVYPNPAKDVLHYSFVLPASSLVQTQVANASGSIVLQEQKRFNAGHNLATLSLQALPKGVYYLKVADANGVQQVKPFAVLY